MTTTTINQKEGKVGMRRIFIVDDHPLFREGLTQFINKEDDLMVCGEAGNMVDAIDEIKKSKPDLVTVDVSLGQGSGIDLIKNLRAVDSSLPILVISMHPDSLYAERVLSAGARGFMNKGMASEKFMEAIRTILGGRIYLSEEMTQTLLEKRLHGLPDNASAINLLSDREIEVFELIGNGQSTALIAEGLHLSPKTIETYRANIKNKLNIKNNTQLIQHAVQWVQSGKYK